MVDEGGVDIGIGAGVVVGSDVFGIDVGASGDGVGVG